MSAAAIIALIQALLPLITQVAPALLAEIEQIINGGGKVTAAHALAVVNQIAQASAQPSSSAN